MKSLSFLKKDSKALDLGYGEWRASFCLAKEGHNVTSVNISKIVIEKTKKFAKEKNLKIKTEVSESYEFLKKSEKFDVIYAMNILQFISKNNIYDVIDEMKKKTKSGGINVIASFIAETEKQKNFVLEKGRYFFDEGELRELYSDWNIEFYSEKLGNLETHGEKSHRYFFVRMIARKK